MVAAQTHPGGSDPRQLEALLEMVRAARGGGYERRVLASTLSVLADWLNEQARLLLLDDGAHRDETRPSVEVLTRRERDIVALIARGCSNREIADDLVIALSTTERHVANILTKLNMRSRAQVAAWAVERSRFLESA